MRKIRTWWRLIAGLTIVIIPLYARGTVNFGNQLEIHGFISQGYLQSDDTSFYPDTKTGTFQFNEMGLTFTLDLSDRLRAGMQFLSRDLGSLGNNTLEVDWAFADYHWKDWLGVRGGILKIPWGIYNDTRDVDMLRTCIFLPSSLYAEEERDAYTSMQGFSLYSHVSLKWFGELNYQALYGDKPISQESAMIRYNPFVLQGGQFDSFDISNIALSYLEWETPIHGLRLRNTTGTYDIVLKAYRTSTAENGQSETAFITQTSSQVLSIFSLEYSWKQMAFAFEGLRVWEQTSEEEDDWEEGDAQQDGWYASLSYRLTDWWEIGTYYAEYYPDADDQEGNKFAAQGLPRYLAWQKELAATVRFDLNAQWTLKVEGRWVNGAARLLPFNYPDIPQEHSVLLAVKTTFNF